MQRKRFKTDLQGMQADCGANYVRLKRLIPQWTEGFEREFIVGVGERTSVIGITITECNPYTTMLQIYQDGTLLPWASGFNLQLRVYHDADMAEVVAWNRHRNVQARYGYPNKLMHQPDEKAQMNRFLGEWLTQCLEYGRSAEPVVLR